MADRPSGRDLVAALGTAAMARGLYPADHPRCQAARSALRERLDEQFAAGRSELTLLLVDDELVADGETLRGTALQSHSLVRALGRLGVERLTVGAGIGDEELSHLLAVLSAEAPPEGSEHVVLGRVLLDAGEAGDGDGAVPLPVGGGAAAGFGGGHVDALTGGLDLLRGDLLAGFAALDRALWQIVEATARESRPLVVLGEMRNTDDRLQRHAITVSTWSLGFARALGFPEASLHDLALGGLLHDVGLLALPPELVFRRGARDDAERAELRRHPRLGALRLCQIPDVGAVPIVVAHEHHVWHDGQGGYPALGRKPNLAARVVAVVDTWDMLYAATAGHAPEQRKAWSAKALQGRAGTWLDPELVGLFVEWVDA